MGLPVPSHTQHSGGAAAALMASSSASQAEIQQHQHRWSVTGMHIWSRPGIVPTSGMFTAASHQWYEGQRWCRCQPDRHPFVACMAQGAEAEVHYRPRGHLRATHPLLLRGTCARELSPRHCAPDWIPQHVQAVYA